MRILHFSDVHIGVENYGRIDPETGLSSRLTDFLRTFDQVVDYALDTRVDLVLFSGDAYKSRDPSQTHQREFARRIARLSSAGIPVFLLVGNHDTPHVIGRATSLEIFNTLDVPNVYTGEMLRTYVVKTNDGPVQIVALPWIRRSAFLARDEMRGLTPDEVNNVLQDRLSKLVRAQAESLDSNLPAILAAHLTVSGATTSSEQSMMLGRDHVLLRSDVALPQFDYVALGHVHRHQILGQNPLVVYSGSLERVDFGEERDEKGFCLIELDPSRPVGQRQKEFTFHAVNARRFLTISMEIKPDDDSPMDTVLGQIAKHDISGTIVRVLIKTPGELAGHLREGEIRAALTEAQVIAAVSREIIAQPRTRLGQQYNRGLDPKDALRLYLESRSVPKDRADILMRHAQGLMDEVSPGSND